MSDPAWQIVVRAVHLGLFPREDRVAVARALDEGRDCVLDELAFARIEGRIRVSLAGDAAWSDPHDLATALNRSLGGLWLVADGGGLAVELLPEPCARVGRDPAWSDVTVSDPLVARRQAVFRWDGARFTVEDAGSASGTWRNGERLQGVQPIAGGDTLRLGGLVLRVEEPSAGPDAAGRSRSGARSSAPLHGVGLREMIDVNPRPDPQEEP